jgi:hypothetical protein
MARAVAALKPGWMVLRQCGLGTSAQAPARARCALVHPRVGIALLDIMPDRSTPEPVERLRRALDQLEFKAIFGGSPPIIYRRLAPGQLPELGIVLATAFAAEAPLALDGGDAWVGGALRALAALAPEPDGALTQVAEPRGPERPSAARMEPEARAPQRQARPVRASAVLCGCLVASTLGGVLLLPGKGSRMVRTEAGTPPPPLLDPVAVPVLPLPGPRLRQPTPLTKRPSPAPEGASTTAPVPATARQPPSASDAPPPVTERLSTRPLAAPALPEQPAVLGMADAPRPAHHLSRSISVTVRPRDETAVDAHCQSIIVTAQLGEEPSDADRAYLRRGCPRR